MERHAVIVGINKYEDAANLPELRGAENDALELKERLEGDGYAIDACLKGSQATCLAVRAALSSLLYRVDKRDLALFYFSGHGFVDSFGEGYIAPFDVSVGDPWVRGISMGEIKELLLKTKNKDSVVVILDCCYSGKAADGRSKGGAAKAPDLAEQFHDVAEELAGSGRIIIASSGKDEKSRERDDLVHSATREKHCHGVFTHRLLEGLDLGATKDADECSVSLGALMDFLSEEMAGEAGATFYSSSLSRPKEINILTRSRRFSLRPELDRVRACLKQGSFSSLIEACRTLTTKILPVTPYLDEVLDLTGEIESKILDFTQLWRAFLKANYVELIMQKKVDKETLDKQSAIIYKLNNFDAFASAESGILYDLWVLDQARLKEFDLQRYCDEVLKSNASQGKESAPPVAKRDPLIQSIARPAQ